MNGELERKSGKNDRQHTLFDAGSKCESEYWWGMPEYSMRDTSPAYRVTVNFLTAKDLKEFGNRLSIPLTTCSDSCWFPHQPKITPGRFEYAGPKTPSRYPVLIPSKGRATTQTTGKALDQLGVDYLFFVEQTEADAYREAIGESKVVSMPFNDLGQGSIPARNFIWEFAREREHKRHWVLDDNIKSFVRCHNNRRLCVRGGGFFRAMEDFVDRFENIGLAGPHHKGFVPDRTEISPILLNSRVYSCILIDTNLPMRWRGKYNEDTDLSLRVLKSGLCTVLFRALLMDKGGTHYGHSDGFSIVNKGAMRGGNTDTVYNHGDRRLAFADSLVEQHPDVAKKVWKFGRWHHQVDYSSFTTQLKYRPGVVPGLHMDNYGMELIDNGSGEGESK